MTKVKNSELINAAWFHLDDCPVNHCAVCALNTKENAVCRPDCARTMASAFIDLWGRFQSVAPGAAQKWKDEEKLLYQFVSDSKPPFGLMPEYVFKEQENRYRIRQINQAIERYKKSGMAVPKEWTDELKRRSGM